MRRVKGCGRLNGSVGGVGDEVDVCRGELAADEAYDFFGVVVGVSEFEIGVSFAVERFGELGGVRDEHDGF